MPGQRDGAYPEANFVAARALAGAIATTLGPTPRDKLVVESLATRSEPAYPGDVPTDEFSVTSDGATLLSSLDLEHPIAPIVRRIAGPERPGATAVVGEDVSDGVTSTLVLAASLLDGAADLIDRGMHPRSIQSGYARGLDVALDALDDAARPLEAFPDPAAARRNVARTAMTGNDVGGQRDRIARWVVDAVETVGMPRPETFVVRTSGDGSAADSRLVGGTVLDRSERVTEAMPRRVDDPRVLVLAGQDEGGLRTREVSEDYAVEANDPADLEGFRDLDADRRRGLLARLDELDVGAVFAQQGIERRYATALANRGIVGVDGVTPMDLRAVALATGARPVLRSTGFESDDLGDAGSVTEIAIEPPVRGRPRRRVIVVDECPDPRSVCLHLRGITGQAVDQVETAARTAAAAVAAAAGLGPGPAGVLPGAGADAVRVAADFRDAAPASGTGGALAVEAFADASEALAGAIAANAGADRLSAVADLRAAHAAGERTHGFVVPPGSVADAVDAGVLDPLATRRGVYVAAVEVASMLLTIDDAVDATTSEAAPDPGDAIYGDAAEQQQSYLETHDDTRWD